MNSTAGLVATILLIATPAIAQPIIIPLETQSKPVVPPAASAPPVAPPVAAPSQPDGAVAGGGSGADGSATREEAPQPSQPQEK